MSNVTARRLLHLLQQQHYRCALSGRELTPDNCSLDHVVPVSRGGSHTLDNVHLVVREVNAAKGTMSQDEFIAMCIDVVEHARSSPPKGSADGG